MTTPAAPRPPDPSLRELAARDRLSVLLIRTSALGDIVQALPVVAALRRHRPGWRVSWVIEESFAPLLEGHRDIERLIAVRTKQWRPSPLSRRTLGELVKLRGALRASGAEVALDVMGNHKSAAIARLSGCPVRIGLAASERREPSSAMWLSHRCRALGEHAVERSLSVLAPLGIPTDVVDFDGHRLCCDEPSPVAQKVPYIVLLPGAGWANKEYPPQRWGQVGAALARQSGMRVVAITGPGEQRLGALTVAASEGLVEALDVPSLPGLTAALRGARLVLGGDTGPVHLAHALKTPVVCVMGPTDPRLHGPWQAPESIVEKPLPCSYCHKRLDGPRLCLLGLPLEAVTARALEVLASSADLLR